MEEIKQAIADALIAARGIRPYYQRAIASLAPVVRPGLGTIAVDKYWRLYVDPEWFLQQTPRHQAGVIACHEIEHLLREHFRLLHLPLAALDLAINDDVAPGDDLLPPDGLLPSKYGLPDGQTEEWYADNLPEHLQGMGCSGGSGAGHPPPDELPPDDVNTPGLSEADAATLRAQVADDVQEHIKKHGRDSVPAGIAIWADAVAATNACRPASWQAVLRLAVQRAARTTALRRGDVPTWTRVSRRSTETQLRPAHKAPPLTLGCIVDTSGSMCEDGAKALGEITTLLRSVTGQGGRVRWVVADAEVTHDSWAVPRQWTGGGGTDMRVAFERIARVKVDAIVVITDTETPWPAAPPAAPVVVATTRDSTEGIPAWATLVRCA